MVRVARNEYDKVTSGKKRMGCVLLKIVITSVTREKIGRSKRQMRYRGYGRSVVQPRCKSDSGGNSGVIGPIS